MKILIIYYVDAKGKSHRRSLTSNDDKKIEAYLKRYLKKNLSNMNIHLQLDLFEGSG